MRNVRPTIATTTAVPSTSTTSVVATATAEAAAAASSATRATLGGLVDTNLATIEPVKCQRTRRDVRRPDGREDIDSLDHVHGGDGSIGICLLAVTDETETTATSGIPVFDDDLRARRSDMKIRNFSLMSLRLPRLGQILRTWYGERCRRCAMRGH